MNIEESAERVKKWCEFYRLREKTNIDFLFSIAEKDIPIEAIETLLTAYEKEKGENVKLRLQDIPLIEGELKAYKDRVKELKQELEKEKEKNKEYKNLLIDMVNQFAYEDFNPKTRGSSEQKLYTGGLSTLEDVFDLLDIDEGIKREDLWKLKEE